MREVVLQIWGACSVYNVELVNLHPFKPNTSGNAAQAFFLTSECAACIFSSHTLQNLDSVSSANSLADNTCKILVPPTADPVIRSKVRWYAPMISALMDPLGWEGQCIEAQPTRLEASFIAKTIRCASFSSISRSAINPLIADPSVRPVSVEFDGSRVSINEPNPLRAAM